MVWVVPSRWATAVVTTTDAAAPPGAFQTHALRVTREALRSAVIGTVNAVRLHDFDAADRAVLRLVDLTSRISATFPKASRLLVVPLGVATLLPYSAAQRRPREAPLVEDTAVTLAPSLAWAVAAHRARQPGGGHIGAFHPGVPPLDLAADRRQFESLVGPNILDRPSAEDVLAALRPGMDIGDFSCHGKYDHLKPFDSRLLLATELRLRAVLDHAQTPWLANLSACETGIPDLQALEQLVSFPTAFLVAGSAHVFATLWPVSNRVATAANGHAYRLLADGYHPADALREAVQNLRNDPESRAEIAPTSIGAEPAVKALAEEHDQQPHTLHQVEPAHPFWWAPFAHYGSPW